MGELINGVPQQSQLCCIHAAVVIGPFVIQQLFVHTVDTFTVTTFFHSVDIVSIFISTANLPNSKDNTSCV